jgi:hypothetical protein
VKAAHLVLKNLRNLSHVTRMSRSSLAHSAKIYVGQDLTCAFETADKTSLTTVVLFNTLHPSIRSHNMPQERVQKSGLAVGINKGHVRSSLAETPNPHTTMSPSQSLRSASQSFRLALNITVITKRRMLDTITNSRYRKSPQSSPPLVSPATRATSASAPPSSATSFVRSLVSPPTSAASSNCSETPRTSARESWLRREYVLTFFCFLPPGLVYVCLRKGKGE